LSQKLEPGEELASVFRSLGKLYETQFESWEKAMDTYEAVLRLEPDDTATGRRLVDIYKRLGLAERATSLLTKIIQQQTSPQDKKRDALYLAELYEDVAADPKRASATLERTRRAWPLDAEVLSAVHGFMNRQGQQSGARMMISRAGKDVRRKLDEGRIDPELLDTLAQVERLSENPEAASLIEVTRGAYVGEEIPLSGGGARALHPDLEQLLAPEQLAYPLRTLLRKTARALDAAFPVDISTLGARPTKEGRVRERLRRICEELGEPTPELLVSEGMGVHAAPLTVQPPRLVVGSRMEDQPDEIIDFLLLRTLKLKQLGGGALSRSRPEDGWPMLVALLHIFAPSFRPAKVDGRKVAQARALVEQGLGRVGYDDDVPTLVLETIGSLGTQGQDIAETPRRLATRAATLATTGPGLALRSLAAGGSRPLPEGGPSRFRFVAQNNEARDVLLFCTTENFLKAREQLKLPSAQAVVQAASGETTSITVASVTSGAPRPPPRPPTRPLG
jgi:tetratricopeptide (TPR) repeat protein